MTTHNPHSVLTGGDASCSKDAESPTHPSHHTHRHRDRQSCMLLLAAAAALAACPHHHERARAVQCNGKSATAQPADVRGWRPGTNVALKQDTPPLASRTAIRNPGTFKCRNRRSLLLRRNHQGRPLAPPAPRQVLACTARHRPQARVFRPCRHL